MTSLTPAFLPRFVALTCQQIGAKEISLEANWASSEQENALFLG